eukprot:9574558-Alexandrium_andersonii.AAC.1
MKEGDAILATQEEIDKALCNYWEKVVGPFESTDEGRAHLHRWLRDLQGRGGTLPPDCPDWGDECVAQAIKAAGSLAPG